MDEIRNLFSSFSKEKITSIDQLPQSGSDRIYFRIRTAENAYIATKNAHVKENETFIYFSRHFKKIFAPVPEILAVNDERTVYIQQDFGDTSLLNALESEGHSDHLYVLFQKSLLALANLQIRGDEGLDYSRCITNTSFGKQAILSDLLYFKYYFLDTLKIPYDKAELISEFDLLAVYLSEADHQYFMYRDFQGRNVMIKDEGVNLIDYQGGMKGALQYDVASLLWQAKAELSDEWKSALLSYYMNCVETILEKPLDRVRFEAQYNGYVLIRLLQVLGAYGFRGLFERKAHFLTSIPLALRNLKWFINNKTLGIELPLFESLLKRVVADELIQKFDPVQANADTPLLVKINSFSFIKTGYPVDETENGGGFVFDCRGILNPGRIEAYKQQNGRDKPVKDYLEQQTRMPEFLSNVCNVVDITIEDYIKRNFKHLVISFGCTGGQHRSVYAADAVARHLRNKYRVKIELNHLEQHIHEVKN